LRAASALRAIVVALLLFGVANAAADTSVFDMAPEQPSTPGASTSLPAPATSSAPEPQPLVKPVTSSNTSGVEHRAILPSDILRLSGEVDSRSWTVELTRQEADSPATLSVGYKSAVVVAPESSRLRVLVNDRLVLEGPISASAELGQLSIKLPVSLLRPGANLFRAEVSQRHRTDCSIASTYELWTDIYSSESSLRFDGAGATTLHRLEDLSAVGPDQQGVAHLRIIAPAIGQTAMARILLQFAQSAAILIDAPNQTVSVSDRAGTSLGAGVLTAVIGTYGDLLPMLRSLPPEAATRPLAAFVDDPTFGPSTLIVSGPTVPALSQAVDGIVSLADNLGAGHRLSVATSHWFAPNAPIARGAARYRLSELGVRTQEFSGRRFKTQFMVALPSDFYAAAYGQATFLLDAAYSGEVLPGSHLDVFVNDKITATAPITTSGGEILRHLPIRMLMTHFKPGPNLIRFEAQLNTTADQLCRTGDAANLTTRFAIFDTSEFVIPDFARIGRLPDLAALMASGFPYNLPTGQTALVINEADSDTVSAAATLLARMAVSGGRTISFDVASQATIGDRNAIFIASADQAPSEVLAQLGIDQSLPTGWKAPADEPIGDVASATADTLGGSTIAGAELPAPDDLDTQATFNRWRMALSEGGGWRGNVSAFQDWLQRTFQFSAASLRFLPSTDAEFETPRGSTILLAQGENPAGNGAWTLMTAPTTKWLRQGAEALTAQKQWSQLAGHIVSYNGKTGVLTTQPVTTFSFLVTQPLSLSNMRLIIANWLSDNILTYSVLLLSACILLGLVTALFLSRIGRGAT
jgi:cellulose synthase operon protein B